jgi:hypothetical protein
MRKSPKIASFLLLASVAMPALVQNEAAAESEEIKEIVLTATRHNALTSDTPISFCALNGLLNLRITEIKTESNLRALGC